VRAVSRVVNFFSMGIFELRLSDLSPVQAFILHWLRVLVVSFHGFVKDGCTMRASSLTYYTLFSIVPVLAMAFGIASGFGLEKIVESRITEMARELNWPTEVMDEIIAFSHAMLKRTKGGVIAGAGFVALFWSVLSIIQSIEQTLNHIWDVQESRTFLRKVTDYLAVIVFTPILIVTASSAAILLESEVAVISSRIAVLGAIRPLIFVALGALPYLSIWAMLTLTYLIIPNTRVRPRSAIVAAAFTGTLYQTVQFLYIKFQLGVTSYGAIYGGFAAIPLFVVWLRLSWMMVLYGAEIAVADENRETYGFRPDISNLSTWSSKLLFLTVFHSISTRFSEAEPAMTPVQISEGLKIPIRLVRLMLNRLTRAGLIVRTAQFIGHEPTFQPARPTEGMRIQTLIETQEHTGESPGAAENHEKSKRMSALLKNLAAAASRLPENVLLREV